MARLLSEFCLLFQRIRCASCKSIKVSQRLSTLYHLNFPSRHSSSILLLMQPSKLNKCANLKPISELCLFSKQSSKSALDYYLTLSCKQSFYSSCHYAFLSSNPKDATGKRQNDSPGRKKASKSLVKEFTIKEKIEERDLMIRLTKMQSLLDKGKTLEVLIKHRLPLNDLSNTKENESASRLQKKIEKTLQGFEKLRRDYSNQHTTKLTIIPSTKPEDQTKATSEEEL